MHNLYLVKIGGSVITNTKRQNVARKKDISRIVGEIGAAGKNKKIIVGHGAGSFGHISAHKYKVNLGIINRDSRKGATITEQAVLSLDNIILKCMIKKGISAMPFSPSSGAMSKLGKIVKWDIKPLQEALKNGFLPVTHGDVVTDLGKGVSIASTEEVFRYIAKYMKPKKIIIGTDVDGIFTSNPKLDKNAKLIKFVDHKNINDVLNSAGKSLKVDVTGGMKSKITYLYNMAKETGATCQIVNAKKKDRIRLAILGKRVVGTIIRA